MANFVKAAATAKRLIEKDGRIVEVFKLNETPTDTTRPHRGSTDQPHVSKRGGRLILKMAFVPLAAGGSLGIKVSKSSLALDPDFAQVGLLATDSIPAGFDFKDVEQADKVRDGDDIWSIKTRHHLRPADRSILFALELER